MQCLHIVYHKLRRQWNFAILCCVEVCLMDGWLNENTSACNDQKTQLTAMLLCRRRQMMAIPDVQNLLELPVLVYVRL